MSKLSTVGLCAAVLALGPAGQSLAAQGPKPVALVVVDVQAVALGYRASKLLHRPITNDQGQEIGKLDDLIIGRDKVLFAIIGVGGFLGLGEHLVAVPYNSLVVSSQRIVLHGATKAAVGKLPQFRYAK
jgi:sporulation protein YlmC with PRC-barrel domain